MSSQATAKCQSDHHSPVPCLSLFPLHISSKGLCSLLLAAEGMHQPSMAEPEGQPNSSMGLTASSTLHIASGGLFQLKVFD